jgi:chromosome segregation ATPase
MVKKKHIKKEHHIEKRETHIRTPGVENILIENFVSLQKVMTNLSSRFDDLANQISKLLELFEISAKALAEKDYEIEKSNKENAKILEKIENVLEQNKTIARGLTLMHDKINEPKSNPQQMYEKQRALPPQRPAFNPVQKTSTMEGAEEYHRPISSNGR